MTPIVRERSEQQAAAGLLRHELALGYGRVDPFAVAKALGIEVIRFAIAERFDGIYRREGERAFVYVNSGVAATRQRFTMAHELGHHRLHINGTTVVDANIDDPEDWQAHHFAGYFLMDEVGVRECIAELPEDTDQRVAAIADSFWVSPPSAAIQLKRYGFINEAELRRFQEHYASSSYGEFMRSRGRQPTPDTMRDQTELPDSFTGRVRRLVEAGQVNLDRAAGMLGMTAEELPSVVDLPADAPRSQWTCSTGSTTNRADE